MCSKFLCAYRVSARRLLASPPVYLKPRPLVRHIFGLIPPSQYDVPIPNRLKLGYAMRVYWEIIPMITVTAFALSCMFGSIIWAALHKVDVVFSSRSRNNISRTMDLRNPTVHKLLIINQKYEPWPEMAELLDKVDVIYTPGGRNNISRTMDLRNPTKHKLVIIHQKYEPWPEMANVLDKMTQAEKRILSRAANVC